MGLPVVEEGGRRYVDVGLPTLVRADFDPAHPPTVEHDGYPDIIHDARHAYRVTTVDELETHWLDQLERAGLEPRWNDSEVVPYINRRRWLFLCPDCGAGNFCWDKTPLGCCLGCGLLVKILWQSPFVRAHAIRLLAVRPYVNGNWDAHKGETVEQLEVENRWMLDQRSTVRDGISAPSGLVIPDTLHRSLDPKVG